MPEPKLFAVAGRPIMHSLSPAMHNAAFHACGINAIYTRISADDAAGALETASEIGMAGLNITAPLKEDCAALCGRLEGAAAELGAVNTIILSKGRAVGHNTDCDGVAGALSSAGVELSGAQAVVLGGGGAARAAAHALLRKGAQVTVANRTEEKAREIARELGCLSCGIHGREFIEAMQGAGVVVSTLSTGMRVVQPRLLRRGMAVLDAIYSQQTALSRDAAASGCNVISGKEWLLWQGATAFEIFTGRKAPIRAMRNAILHSRTTRAKNNIALVGFMGSGKSALATRISALFGMRLIDTDREIEKKWGKSIREIFEKDGEAAFRRLERRTVARAASSKGCVIACGGGAVLDRRNVAGLRRSCTVAWLWASPREILRRVGKGKQRPLLNVQGRKAAVRRLLASRIPSYAYTADFVAKSNAKNVSGLVLDEVSDAKCASKKNCSRVDA